MADRLFSLVPMGVAYGVNVNMLTDKQQTSRKDRVHGETVIQNIK